MTEPIEITFTAITRKLIERGFDKEWGRLYKEGRRVFDVGHPEHRISRSGFVGSLESYAEGFVALRAIATADQKTRVRRLESMAKALGKLSEKLAEVDSDSLAYVLYLAVQDHAGEAEASTHSPLEYWIETQRNIGDVTTILSSFHRATLRACKSLHVNEFNLRLQNALAIERLFADHGFEFTVSASGFAATCLAAVLEAAGEPASSLQYWLEQAQQSPESMASFAKRQSQD